VARLILASASQTRRDVLRGAGFDFDTQPASGKNVDEGSIKDRYRSSGISAEETALYLARAKALDISRDNPDALVIGADQVLEQDGVMFDKPADRAAARRHLETFSGKTHRLVTAAVLFRGRDEIWRDESVAAMTVRPLSPEFIESYLDTVGDRVCDSVGAYQLEGMGAQLFERIEGDFFTILGLPLLPLLAFLRDHGHIPS